MPHAWRSIVEVGYPPAGVVVEVKGTDDGAPIEARAKYDGGYGGAWRSPDGEGMYSEDRGQIITHWRPVDGERG